MLVQYKKIFLFFFIFIVTLLSHTISLFCKEANIQSSNFTDNYTEFFNYFYNINNKKMNKEYIKHKLNSEKKIQQVYSSVSGKTEPWSNAFNFKKVWGSTVDPRTGILSAYVKTGSMLSNLGHGPDINLDINYNSSSLANPDGLGTGWSWNLTHFNLVTHQLITSFGQSFYLEKSADDHWKPLYHKLHDMVIQGDISTHFVITYANGLRETLNHKGYEVRLEQQDGWGVCFSYVPGTHLLQSIKDAEGHSIKLYRKNHDIQVVSQGSVGKPVIILINEKNSEIRSVTLPLSTDNTGHGIYFYYVNHFITSVHYPTGLKNRITYNCADEIKVPVYSISVFHALCAVVKETVDPGFGEPVMVSRYRYGKTNSNEHNYLSFNAELNITTNSPKDRLFEAPVSYTYQTEQDNGLIREIRTYNKYHLMTDEQQISDRTRHVLSAVHYFFCRTDQFDGCANTTFDDLPSTYSLPLKIITQVWGNRTDTPVITTVTARYDALGRVIRKTDIYGRVTINNYCPLTGDTVCPAVSNEWPFATLTESTTHYPANTKISTNSLSPVTIYNYYRKKINYNGKGYITILDHQIKQSGNQQLTAIRRYYNNPDDLLTYGLLKQLIITGKKNEADLSDSVVKDYYYIKSPDNYAKTTYSAIELSENKRLMSSYTTTSLFTNQILIVTDAEKKYSNRYYYDQWDRLIKTERAAGTDFSASIYYSYTISENLNQVMITAVNGLQKKVVFDSAGRVLKNFIESIDTAGKQQQDHWWPVKKISYDQYGRIARRSSYIFKESGQIMTLDITHDYDDTGRVMRTYLPDGRITVMHYDDSNRCVVSYQQSAQGERSVISVSKANVLSQPVRQWLLPATKGPLPSVRSLCINSDKQPDSRVSVITYDGFGRQIMTKDPGGRVIRQNYDSLGWLTDTTDPAGNRMHSVYNLTGHIVQSWVYPVAGGRYLLSSSGYNRAGQLLWSAGEDGKRTFYTYTTDGMIATVIKPHWHVFSWQYNILNLPVSQSADNKIQWSIIYNNITLNLQKKTDITGTKTYAYSDDGLIQELIHVGKNSYSDYKLQWKYDNNRRIINTTDISGNTTANQYDQLGRITRISYQSCQKNNIETLFVPVYDGFSRIKSISYGSGLYRVFHYNAWGHKDQITDTQKKQLISAWSMIYGINGNIVRLSQITENKQLAMLHYRYDRLDNLVSMRCQGSSGLPLCPHDTSLSGSGLKQAPVIIRQDYTFTPLNRLESIQEVLQPLQQKQTISKTINYYYTNTKMPLRFQQISTAWNHNKPVLQNFIYDDMGNMTADGQNNHITYNALNEVVQVISSTGKLSDYTYDGSGKEVIEKNIKGLSYFFYYGDTLINEKIIDPQQGSHITGYLGVAKTTDGIISEYYQSSYKGDITGIFKKNNDGFYCFQQRNIYSPYGMIWHEKSKTLPLYQQTLQGFDGERTDPATGWQFLGNGNRTYNPAQRYFLSEDPAGGGYAFGSNNPVMNTDPSGNSPRWLGEAFKWAGYISTLGLGALHQRWANITAAVIQTGCTVATLGAAAAGAGYTALAGIVAGTTAIGSIPVVAAAMPANKGLNIAGKIIGMAEMTISVAAGAIDLAAGAAGNNEMLNRSLFYMLKTSGQCSSVPVQQYTGEAVGFFMPGSSHFMTVPVQPDLSALKLIDLETIVKDLSCCHIFEGAGSRYLQFTDHNSVEDVWCLLRHSSFKDQIHCDTGTILKAYQLTGTLLHLPHLYGFLVVRSRYSQFPVCLTLEHPYIKALQSILLPTGWCYNSKYNVGVYSLEYLSRLANDDNFVVVSSYSHMTIVQKLEKGKRNKPALWAVNQFSDNGINIVNIRNNQLGEVFSNPLTDEIFINGYMRIK